MIAMDEKKYEAKLRFANAYVGLCSNEPVERITVGQISDAAGRSRKTFYCHFADKEELPRWIFRYDLACGLEAAFAPDSLVYATKDAFSDLPLYARTFDAKGRIDNALFFETLSLSLERRRDYYRKQFSIVGVGTLDTYLHEVYTPLLREDVLHLIDIECGEEGFLSLGGRASLDRGSTIDFLAEFYTGAFISRIIRQIHDAPSNRTIEDIRPFQNIIHESLRLMIREHVVPR